MGDDIAVGWPLNSLKANIPMLLRCSVSEDKRRIKPSDKPHLILYDFHKDRSQLWENRSCQPGRLRNSAELPAVGLRETPAKKRNRAYFTAEKHYMRKLLLCSDTQWNGVWPVCRRHG